MNTVDVGIKYEQYCMQLLSDRGYTEICKTKASGDQGIDIIAYRDGVKYGFQCKYYSSAVGNHAVQEASAGAKFYECNVAIVITNQTFTEAAKKLANKIGVILWEKIKMHGEPSASYDSKEEKIYTKERNKEPYMPLITSDSFVFYHFLGEHDVYTNIFLDRKPGWDFYFEIKLPYLNKTIIVPYHKNYGNGTSIALDKCGLANQDGTGRLYCIVMIGGNHLKYKYPDIYLPIITRNNDRKNAIILSPTKKKPIEVSLPDRGKVMRLKDAGYNNACMYIEIIK